MKISREQVRDWAQSPVSKNLFKALKELSDHNKERAISHELLGSNDVRAKLEGLVAQEDLIQEILNLNIFEDLYDEET